MSSISRFIGKFDKDLARPCNFEVTFFIPTKWVDMANLYEDQDTIDFINKSEATRKEIKYYCEAAELPGRTFALVDQKTYGPIEQYPIQSSYNKMNLTLMCSDDMRQKNFIDTWMELMSASIPTRKYKLTNQSSVGVRFDFEYKDGYACDIVIEQKNLVGDVAYSALLSDAFPVECHPMPLNWGAVNDYHRLNVTFAYRYSYNSKGSITNTSPTNQSPPRIT